MCLILYLSVVKKMTTVSNIWNKMFLQIISIWVSYNEISLYIYENDIWELFMYFARNLYTIPLRSLSSTNMDLKTHIVHVSDNIIFPDTNHIDMSGY